MSYSTDDRKYRVDFFKGSGKWSHTVEVIGLNYHHGDIFEAVAKDMIEAGYSITVECVQAVALDPYHKNTHPVILKSRHFF